VFEAETPPWQEVPPAELVGKGKRGAGLRRAASSHAFAPAGSGLGRGARSQLCSPLSLRETMLSCPSGVPRRRGRAFPSSSPAPLRGRRFLLDFCPRRMAAKQPRGFLTRRGSLDAAQRGFLAGGAWGDPSQPVPRLRPRQPREFPAEEELPGEEDGGFPFDVCGEDAFGFLSKMGLPGFGKRRSTPRRGRKPNRSPARGAGASAAPVGDVQGRAAAPWTGRRPSRTVPGALARAGAASPGAGLGGRVQHQNGSWGGREGRGAPHVSKLLLFLKLKVVEVENINSWSRFQNT